MQVHQRVLLTLTLHIPYFLGAEVGAVGGTDSSDIEGAAAPQVFHPAVVEGEKAVQAALSEGLFPVLDKTIDVFAVPSSEG